MQSLSQGTSATESQQEDHATSHGAGLAHDEDSQEQAGPGPAGPDAVTGPVQQPQPCTARQQRKRKCSRLKVILCTVSSLSGPFGSPNEVWHLFHVNSTCVVATLTVLSLSQRFMAVLVIATQPVCEM